MNSFPKVGEVVNGEAEAFRFPSLGHLNDVAPVGVDASVSTPTGALTPVMGFDAVEIDPASETVADNDSGFEGNSGSGAVDLESSRVRLATVYAQELDELREAARQEGYDTGYAYGKSVADAEVAAAVAKVEADGREAMQQWTRETTYGLAALREASARFEERSLPVLDDLSDSIVDAAVTLLEELFGRELAVLTDPGRDAVERAMRLLDTDQPVVVKINPVDYDLVDEALFKSLPANVSVRPDVNVERAGAVAEAGATRVDAQLSAALKRAKQGLGR